MKKYLGDYLFLFSIAGTIVILDQITKSLVRANLGFGEIWSPWPWLEPYARIVNWHNTGAAFGIFQGLGTVFTILAFIVSGAIIYFFPRVPRDDWIIRLALALELGGAVGNLIDRLQQGYVTDFVSVGGFAVWNVADASISIGVVLLIFGVWQRERKEKASNGGESEDPASPRVEIAQTPQTEELEGE